MPGAGDLTLLLDGALRGEVDHVLCTVGGDGLEGEDVHVLHAEGRVEDTDVEALLDGELEGEAPCVLHEPSRSPRAVLIALNGLH